MALDKLIDSTQLDTDLTSVANAIRTKGGTSESLAFPSGFVSAIQNISTGGGSSEPDVIFIDYDGTTVATKTKAEINAMTSDSDLPANPTHTGLTAQGWNWTVAQLKAQLTAMPTQKVYVGQMYITTSGATEIDVEMHDGRLSPILTIAVKGTITVDWGDNTTPNTVTGTSLTSRKAVGPHAYTSAGSYTIKIAASSGSYSFYCSDTYNILRRNTTVTNNKVYTNCVKAIRIGNDISTIATYAFYNCSSLASVTIPSSVTSIGNNAFNYCSSLSSITIPSGAASISNNAFQNCYSLASIAIPSSVTSIGQSLFYNCRSLARVEIPSSVTSISENAFYECSSLTSITIPSSATSIGASAFYNCSSLASVTISSSVTSIGDSAFYGCYSLTRVEIPSSVTSIGANAFYNCSSLASITIPSGITSIGASLFYGCYSLARVEIPSSVTSIGASAFYNCPSLASITIPSDTTSIGGNAFYYCYSLAKVTVPSGVENIYTSTFSYCYNVAEYHFQSENPPELWATNAFYNISSDCIIYVPYSEDHSILNSYKTATNWSTYASKIQEEPQ